jgi:hypothetical protein
MKHCFSFVAAIMLAATLSALVMSAVPAQAGASHRIARSAARSTPAS